MRKVVLMLGIALFAGFIGVQSANAQLRVPPTHVAALAVQPSEDETLQEPDAGTRSSQPTAQVLPIQLVMPQQEHTSPAAPQNVVPQNVVPQAVMTPQVQLQAAMPQFMPQPGMMSGAIVIPVVVPQYMTYTPPPMTMMVNQPAQLVIPQYSQYAPHSQYSPQMMVPMPQYMMPQPMTPQQMMIPQSPPLQPIPVKMILPDGSKISIKHYVPGQYFKNALRAVTP